MSEFCEKCGAKLGNDEIGLTRKLVNRGIEKFWCLACLGEHFGLGADELLGMIERFRRQNCGLFARGD